MQTFRDCIKDLLRRSLEIKIGVHDHLGKDKRHKRQTARSADHLDMMKNTHAAAALPLTRIELPWRRGRPWRAGAS
jgi:hypothetical protein